MKAIDYCKKYGLSPERLFEIVGKNVDSSYILSSTEQRIYLSSLNTERKKRKKETAIKKGKKKIKSSKSKPDPWNKDNLKVKAWILRK